MPFEIIRNDITKVKADAIVDAANANLQQGGGVCGAIFAAAGAKDLQKECDAIGGCAVGGAVITKGYNLPADYIIHVVGPIWHGGDKNEETLLRNAYNNALGLAKEYGLQSIAFPLISAGIYGYPKEQALKVATQTIQAFLAENDMLVTLVIYDNKAFELSEKLFNSVTQYIEDNFEVRYPSPEKRRLMPEFDLQEMRADDDFLKIDMDSLALDLSEVTAKKSFAVMEEARTLDDIKLDETFSKMLLRLIDEKGKTDTEVYKKANIDRKLFSKIRNNKNYRPSKSTALALAIALELSLDETKDLLLRAGMAISHSNYFDIIVEYFIKEGIYNIFEINEALFKFEQPLLGV
ncbi:MAG TPA: macro domain-containing protein [Clostridia bacterium]|nr:macro domain-containing protein [Clostridia bacterium]